MSVHSHVGPRRNGENLAEGGAGGACGGPLGVRRFAGGGGAVSHALYRCDRSGVGRFLLWLFLGVVVAVALLVLLRFQLIMVESRLHGYRFVVASVFVAVFVANASSSHGYRSRLRRTVFVARLPKTSNNKCCCRLRRQQQIGNRLRRRRPPSAPSVVVVIEPRRPPI